MESPNTTQLRLEKNESAPDQETPGGGASLFVRLWAYGGPGQPLSGLVLDSDPEVTELIRVLIIGSHGQITDRWPEGLVARFNKPLYALSAAKMLQHRLLSFHRPTPPQQVVASILISGRKNQAGPADHAEVAAIAQMLVDGNFSAQILVSEAIYELAQNVPGFHFNSRPVREAGEAGAAEAIYELLWTDESTYGHLREAGQSTGIHTAGRYQIQAELGRGAMGVVYKAYDQLIGRTVALKTISIDRNAPNRKELIERLKQEAKAAGGLDHPNIITIYDVGQEDDRVYLSMQFLEGKTLNTLLAEGDLPPLPTLISYAEQICSAVGFAHARGVIHRDLKPANLMLTSQGVIKVLDFGIAKLEDATLTQTGLVVGTPTHMAPEQASDRKIDHRTDIFALGSVFYELFTREKPFKGDVATILYKIIHEDPVPPSVINPGLPSGIDAIIRKALAKGPKERFQSCEEMGKAFHEQAALLTTAMPGVAADKVVAAAPAPRPAVSSPSYLLDETTTVRPPRRMWPALVTVLLLAAGGAAGWAFYVKSHTGAFPPLVEKVVAGLHRGEPQTAANGSLSSPHSKNDGAQKGQDKAADPASVKSGDAGTGNSPASNGVEPVTTQAAATQPGQSSTASPSEQNQAVTNSSGAAISTPSSGTPLPTSDSTTSSAAPSQPSASAQPSSASQPGNDQSAQPSEQAAEKPARNPAPEASALKVDGFARRDVPELLRQADAAAGRGDYRLARYEYTLILKLDRSNAAARTGLRRVQAAQQDRP